VRLAQELSKKEKILELEDGGGNKMIKKNVDCIVSKEQKKDKIKETK
jgi:hypothetical protein